MRRLLQLMLLPGFALCLIAALWASVAYHVRQDQHNARSEAVQRSEALARVLSEHVSHILRQTDHATQLFKLKFEETDGRLRLPEFVRRGGLLDSVIPARLGLPIALTDRNGLVIDRVNEFIDDDLSATAWFRALAGSPAEASIFSTPVVDARTKKWQIQVTRRLNDGAGVFAGAIVIMIDPAFFVDDYDRLNVEEDGALILISPDPGLATGRLGERLFQSDQIDFARAGDSSVADEVQPRVALDKVRRVYGTSEMPRYGLTAVVGVTEVAAMGAFEHRRRLYLWISAGATVLIMLIVAALMRQSARLQASIEEARDAQAKLRAAVDASLDAFFVLQAWPPGALQVQDFVLADMNDKGAAMLGHPRNQMLGQKLFAMLPQLRQVGFFERYTRVYRSRVPLEEEVELPPDGARPQWLQHQIVRIPGGVAITSRDITERKRAEIEIRSNRSFLLSLVANLPLLIAVKNAGPANFGTMVEWNKAAEHITGFAAADVIGRRMADVFPPDFGLSSDAEDHAMVASPAIADHLERPIRLADGSLRYLHAISVPLLDELGKVEYILCIAEDITQRREQEQHLRSSEAELAAMTNASPLGLVQVDVYGHCTYVNRRFETITGMAREQAMGFGWFEALDLKERAFFDEVFEHQRNSDEPYQRVMHFRRADGVMAWMGLKIAAIRIGYRIEGFVATLDDITTLREAELALRESESRLRTIADTMPAMVAFVDAHEVYRFQNLAYEREFCDSGCGMLGRTIREVLGERRYASLKPYINRALLGEAVVFEDHAENDGTDRALEVSYIPQLAADGKTVAGFHVMRHDITTLKREKKHLLKLTQLDPLTGLANRAGFMHKLDAAMLQSAEMHRLMAVMYMDIDHFKPVNDTYGHSVGDALLKVFSARLEHTMRASDTIARLGGDEFTIIMEKLTRPEDATATAAKIVAAMQQPFELDGVIARVSVSIGVAYYRGGAADAAELLHQADMLLYQAKQAGRNTFRAAAPELVAS